MSDRLSIRIQNTQQPLPVCSKKLSRCTISLAQSAKKFEYKTFGTRELAEEAFHFIHEDNGILLGNHGVLTIGPDLASAFGVAKDIEFLAKLDYRARCIGTPKLLNQEQMKEVLEKFETYGQQ